MAMMCPVFAFGMFVLILMCSAAAEAACPHASTEADGRCPRHAAVVAAGDEDAEAAAMVQLPTRWQTEHQVPNSTSNSTGTEQPQSQVSASATATAAAGAEAQLVPKCPNMVTVSFAIKYFKPSGSGFPVSSSGEMDVYGCSNIGLLPEIGTKGVVLFLHGAGGHADDYAGIYPANIYRPDDYNIIFLQTPRGTATKSSWMSTADADLNHHWDNNQVMDNMFFLNQIINSLALFYHYPNIWIAGYSQGAVMSAAVALKATNQLLGGAFIVAGYPPRPLYTDEDGPKDVPSDWSAADVEDKKQTKIYFYTGEFDSVLPISKSFCRFKRVVDKYGLSSANYRFWSKTGYCHYNTEPLPSGGECSASQQISPNGNEFHALWHLVSGEPDSVAGVVTVTPSTDCTA